MMYPPELANGDRAAKSNELGAWFKEHGWETSWDFDKNTGDHWYDVYLGDKKIMQVEFTVSVEGLIKDLRKLIPALRKVKKFDQSSLEKIAEELNGQSVYFFNEDNPSEYARSLM